MPKLVPTRDDLETETLDGDMRASDVIGILRHLQFRDGLAVIRLDREARNYLITSVSERLGSKRHRLDGEFVRTLCVARSRTLRSSHRLRHPERCQ